MSGIANKVAAARTLIHSVLQGKVSRETHPELFDEEALMMSVRILEQEDPAWLLQELGDPGVNANGKEEIGLLVSAKIRTQLGLEDPLRKILF